LRVNVETQGQNARREFRSYEITDGEDTLMEMMKRKMRRKRKKRRRRKRKRRKRKRRKMRRKMRL